MKREPARKALGQRLIGSMKEGLAAVRETRALPTRFVPLPPGPPPFEPGRLVSLRKRFGLSQAGLAALLNVSDKAVESWEQGVRSPNGAALRLLQMLADPALLRKMVAPYSKGLRARTKIRSGRLESERSTRRLAHN